jgi:GT2 family glycosyltransferase
VTPPDLSVIVVNWNSRDVTAACLDSFRERTAGVTYELFLIDNGSTKDDSATDLPRRFPWAKFIANPDNRGFTRANNQGIREACGRYVLLLNSDTIQTQNAAGAAVAYMDAHPDVGALGIEHRNADADRTFQPSAHPFPRPWGDTRAMLGLGGRPAPLVTTDQDVDWVCGSFLLIRRAALEQVGPLDERYFAYNEDIDWCLAARRAGWKVRYWPGASQVHIGSVAAPHLRDKTGLMFRSHVTYLRKNHGPLPAAAYYAATGVRLALATAKQALMWLAGRSSRADLRGRWTRLTHFLALRRHST